MQTVTKDSLNEIFLNVRKAYRLLFDYQDKLLSLVKYISNHYSYSYSGGWPLFSNPCPKRGQGNLESWAWDWLNMYAYGFHFGSKTIKNRNVTFEIRIYSDTGFYDNKSNNPKDLNTYKDIYSSKTKLVLVASNLGWEINNLLKDFTSEKSEYVIKNSDNNICAKSYDLEEFINEDKTIEKLNDFVNFCKSNGIGLM